MTTFLPYSNFYTCASVLDYRRLGKQRPEAKWVLDHLLGKLKWKNHPLLRMWKGHEEALCHYGMAMCQEWKSRGYKDELFDYFFSYSNNDEYEDPPWLGNERLHSSHRSRLITKDPHWYSQFGWEETPNESIGYFWPL